MVECLLFTMAKTIKRNFVYNLLLQISAVLFPIITAPYIARMLDPDGVGIVNFVNTYASYFALFAVLGIPTYGIREIAKRQGNLKEMERFLSQMISIELVSTFVISLLFIGSVLWIDQLKENALLFLLAGISLYMTPFKIEWFFKGQEKFGYITFRSLVIRTVSILLLFVFVRTKHDLVNYVLLSLFSTIANEFWNYLKVLKLGIRPYITFKGCKTHLKAVLVLLGSSVAISIYVMLDTLMLGFLADYSEVGYYNSAIHLVKAVLPLATALSAVALPRVASFMQSNDMESVNALMQKSLNIVSFLVFPMTMGIILVAPTFVPLFFGSQFEGAILPMQVGAVLLIAIGLNNLNGIQILTGMGKDKQFLMSVTSGAVSNFILNLILIPRYGAVGAAISSVYAEVQIFLVNEYFVRRDTVIRVNHYADAAKSLIGACLFVPLCYAIGRLLEGWTFVIVAVLACSIAYMISQYVLRNSIYGLVSNLILPKIKARFS